MTALNSAPGQDQDARTACCALAGVQARVGKAGRVADVVQPCGDFQQIGISAEHRCQAARPRGDTLDVCLAAGEGLLEECPGVLFGLELLTACLRAGRQRTVDEVAL